MLQRCRNIPVCAFYQELKKTMHIYLPDAVLKFQSRKKPEIVKKGSDLPLTDVTLSDDSSAYPPKLFCSYNQNKLMIVFNIEQYYTQEDLELIKQAGKADDIAVLGINIENILVTQEEIREYLTEPYSKTWIYNRLVEDFDKKYRHAATEPARFHDRYICFAQKDPLENVYSAGWEDCNRCAYCYKYGFCLAKSYINHAEDFEKPFGI